MSTLSRMITENALEEGSLSGAEEDSRKNILDKMFFFLFTSVSPKIFNQKFRD